MKKTSITHNSNQLEDLCILRRGIIHILVKTLIIDYQSMTCYKVIDYNRLQTKLSVIDY